MPVKNENSTSFRNELAIISPWAYVIAIAVFLSIVLSLVFLSRLDKNPPPVPLMLLGGIIGGTFLGVFVLLVGYVDRDAGRRGMSRPLWTMLAIFIPNGLGIVLYFLLRKPRLLKCPQCGAIVAPDFGFCPSCRHELTPVCPKCQHSVNASDKFCPYCGAELRASANEVIRT